MIELPRRRHRMPGIRQPPTDFRKLSPQLEVGYSILRHQCQREGPSVERCNSRPETHRQRTLRQPEFAQFGAEFLARHPPTLIAEAWPVKQKWRHAVIGCGEYMCEAYFLVDFSDESAQIHRTKHR